MGAVIRSEAFILLLNLAAYIAGGWVIRKLKLRLLNALIVAMFIVIGALLLTGIDYRTYAEGSRILNFMLGPAVVAIGYVLHREIKKIRANLLPICVAIVAGAFVNLLTVNAILLAFGADLNVIYSLQPKSVTMPIAISLSQIARANVPVTVIAVVVTGLLGSIIGPWLLKITGVRDPIARGLAMGSASHAIGTARAMEMGMMEGAVSGLAIGLMGVATAIILPLCRNFLLM